MKHLGLGLLLLVAASGVLLLSDWNRRETGKLRKIRVVELNNVLDVEETEQGVMAGLKESGLVEGRDYEIKVSNAQGDMATVNALIDAALTEGADLLLTLSSPTLQAALQKTQRIPIVFGYVASGVAAGAGRTDQDHRPNVTGVYFAAAYAEMMALMRECLPSVRVVGTLFAPSEVNSVYHKDIMVREATQAGLEVVTVAVSTATEVADAALALCSRKIDALCQIPGNLTAAAFSSIAPAARRARLPIFAFQTSQARDGAAVVLARDYAEAGRETGLIAAEVLRGANPAGIPFRPVGTTRLVINPQAARAAGFQIPAAVARRANEVIKQSHGSN